MPMRLRQNLSGAAAELFEYSAAIPVIDCHEHIPGSEKAYNDTEIRWGNLFNPYISNDLASAGMDFPPDEWAAFVCVDEDWDAFAPAWNAVKHGSYARALRIALQEFYGTDDFTPDNYLDLVKQINANNTPGIYRRVFRDKCNIERIVRCDVDMPDPAEDLLVGNVFSPALLSVQKSGLERMAADVGAGPIGKLDELLEVAGRWMELQVARGAIEFKSRAEIMENPDRDKAAELLGAILAGTEFQQDEAAALHVFVREFCAKKVAELDSRLALHTGVWGDFRSLDVRNILGFVARHPDTPMDIYHLGIPNVRDCVHIVKNYPNAYLNLCWAHVVASDLVVSTMKEAMDQLPMNKVFAFGADYVLFIEKGFGHLWMARENVSIVLGDRVDRNLMDIEEAKVILKAWFYDNPKRFYGL